MAAANRKKPIRWLTKRNLLRTGRLSPSEASAALASFDLLAARSRPLRHGRADFEAAEKLVRDFTTKLAAPDALHLVSAKNAGAVLATFDARLADAARAQGVEVAG
jgi:predicted nucleic acid-binding protein